eukprot:SAG31_NODE_10449_length_1137_cov_0.944123_1_plen_146_part_10
MSAVAIFCVFQMLEICEYYRRKDKLSWVRTQMLRVTVSTHRRVHATCMRLCAQPHVLLYKQVFLVGLSMIGLVTAMLWPTGYFGPFSARIRGLFVKHTRTGNPLVDSVAEHQPVRSPTFISVFLCCASSSWHILCEKPRSDDSSRS